MARRVAALSYSRAFAMQYCAQVEHLHAQVAPDMPMEAFVAAVNPQALGFQSRDQLYAPVEFAVQIAGALNGAAGAVRVRVPVHANPNWLSVMKHRFATMIGQPALPLSQLDFRTVSGRSIGSVPVDQLHRVGKLSVFVKDQELRLPQVPAIPIEYSVTKMRDIDRWITDTVEDKLPALVARYLSPCQTVEQLQAAVRGDGPLVKAIEGAIQGSDRAAWAEFVRTRHVNAPIVMPAAEATKAASTIASNVLLSEVRRMVDAAAPQIKKHFHQLESARLAKEMAGRQDKDHFAPILGLADHPSMVAGEGESAIENVSEFYSNLAEDIITTPSVREAIAAAIYSRPMTTIGCRWHPGREPDAAGGGAAPGGDPGGAGGGALGGAGGGGGAGGAGTGTGTGTGAGTGGGGGGGGGGTGTGAGTGGGGGGGGGGTGTGTGTGGAGGSGGGAGGGVTLNPFEDGLARAQNPQALYTALNGTLGNVLQPALPDKNAVRAVYDRLERLVPNLIRNYPNARVGLLYDIAQNFPQNIKDAVADAAPAIGWSAAQLNVYTIAERFYVWQKVQTNAGFEQALARMTDYHSLVNSLNTNGINGPQAEQVDLLMFKTPTGRDGDMARLAALFPPVLVNRFPDPTGGLLRSVTKKDWVTTLIARKMAVDAGMQIVNALVNIATNTSTTPAQKGMAMAALIGQQGDPSISALIEQFFPSEQQLTAILQGVQQVIPANASWQDLIDQVNAFITQTVADSQKQTQQQQAADQQAAAAAAAQAAAAQKAADDAAAAAAAAAAGGGGGGGGGPNVNVQGGVGDQVSAARIAVYQGSQNAKALAAALDAVVSAQPDNQLAKNEFFAASIAAKNRNWRRWSATLSKEQRKRLKEILLADGNWLNAKGVAFSDFGSVRSKDDLEVENQLYSRATAATTTMNAAIDAHHPWNAMIHNTIQPMLGGAYPAYYNAMHTKQDMTAQAPYIGNLEDTYRAYHLFGGVPVAPLQGLARIGHHMRRHRAPCATTAQTYEERWNEGDAVDKFDRDTDPSRDSDAYRLQVRGRGLRSMQDAIPPLVPYVGKQAPPVLPVGTELPPLARSKVAPPTIPIGSKVPSVVSSIDCNMSDDEDINADISALKAQMLLGSMFDSSSDDEIEMPRPSGGMGRSIPPCPPTIAAPLALVEAELDEFGMPTLARALAKKK